MRVITSDFIHIIKRLTFVDYAINQKRTNQNTIIYCQKLIKHSMNLLKEDILFLIPFLIKSMKK